MSTSRDQATPCFTAAGLFAGVGGLELGLGAAGAKTIFLSEKWDAASAVLRRRFRDTELPGALVEVKSLRNVDVVTAGFPCTDLSQAGKTAGIDGSSSGLVLEALDLIKDQRPPWVVLENVPNMLYLSHGRAMEEITTRLEQARYAWAYRVVDSRAFGVPQRRRRVFLVAAQDGDPAAVLFTDDRGEHDPDFWCQDASGFYWTEGNRGIGWALDAVPPLKGSTTASVPSPPGVWLPGQEIGQRIVTPTIRAAEAMQGFPPGWTEDAPDRDRWKLIGNAVTPQIAEWIGKAIQRDGESVVDALDRSPLSPGDKWPKAAYGSPDKRWAVRISEWPVRRPYHHLATLLDRHGFVPLSARATRGFRTRLARSRLRYDPAFYADLLLHEEWMSSRG